jgi:predicted NBD/HSP70 family sugar kinase
VRPANLWREEFTEKEKRSIEILDILKRKGPISRPDISQEMGVNVVTISNYIDDFIKSHLVLEKEFDISEGGRRPLLLDLNGQGGYVIGVGLNLMNMVGVLIDLKGNIITKTQIARPRYSVKEISECLLEITREILRRSKEYTADIRGIGIGIAGLVNKKDGSVHWPQKMDHYYTYASVDIPFRSLIEKEFNIPVLVENDATAACFGERWINLERGYRNVLYMFSGVGCGMMLDGNIYSGTHGYAGEIAISNFKGQDFFNCDYARSCFIKRWEADLGIIEEAKTLLAQDSQQAEQFFKLTSSSPENLDLKSVFAANRSGNPLAAAALEGPARRLGIKIATLVNIFDPQIVIIGGGLEEAGDNFLNKVNEVLRQWAFREITEDLKVAYSSLRENAVALGAASLVTQRVFARVW